MKRIFAILVALLAGGALAVAGAESEGSASTAMEDAPTGLYPEHWQFTDLEEMALVTGTMLTEFHEAPMLAARVAAGELPPVEERIPSQPLVIVRNEIGSYGGTLRTAHEGTVTGLVLTVGKFMEEFALAWNPELTETGPNILRGVDVSADATEFTFHLRAGMRWSDGEPHTADDYLFMYEADAMNPELRPSGLGQLKIGGEMGVATKIDDYTVKWTFPSPFGYWPQILAQTWQIVALPEHYLSQFHPDYAAKADLDSRIKEEGYEDWVTLWSSKKTWVINENPDMPSIRSWLVLTDGMAPVNRMVRNPYYWKIDLAGNQLPYIDEIESVLVEREAMKLKVIAGEIDYITGELLDLWSAETYALLKEYEEQGNFTVRTSRGAVINIGSINLNLTHADPFYRELFNQKDFRVALSVGIDRDEINEVVFRGSAIPAQVGPTYKEEGWSDKYQVYIEYDPDEANRLLDGLGLQWNGDRSARMRPDGKPIKLVALVESWRIGAVEMTEMYAQTWKDLGLDVAVKPMVPGGQNPERDEGRYEMIVGKSYGGSATAPIIDDDELVPYAGGYWAVSNAWAAWVISGGEEGEAPPEELQADVERLWEIVNEFQPEADAAVREGMLQDVYDINLNHLWTIGGMNQNPDLNFNPYNNNLRNVVGKTFAWQAHVPGAWFYAQ